MNAIPDKILERHLGILGINGSGKTYTAKGCVEKLLDSKQRVCIIDPTGVWWGLKSSADGKRGAYPVVVFGGEHADLQISGSHGEAIAEAIGTSDTPAIIDTSLMRGAERTKFFTDFAETLRIKNSGPLNLFIDEAHLFCPQGRVSDPHSAQMLHAANNLISLGRARGLRVTLISQRPAKMHKDSLTQVHTLIAMRLIAPQDRNAVEAWISDQADVARGKDIIASLPQLKTGEGYLWAPELDILERVKFPKIKTFDSSRAPEEYGHGEGPVLKPIDLSSIEGRLANIKTEAARNDPDALKRRVKALEKALAEKTPIVKEADPSTIDKARQGGYQDGLVMGFSKGRDAMLASIKGALEQIERKPPQLAKSKITAPAAPVVMATEKKWPVKEIPFTAQEQSATDREIQYELNGPQLRIVDSMRFWKSIGHDTPTREQVAACASYDVNGGSFTAPVGQLCTQGIIDKPATGRLRLIRDPGGEKIDPKANILSFLDGPQRRVISSFLTHDPTETLTRAEVASRAAYDVNGGSFTAPTGKLCTLGILEKPETGMLKMSDWAIEVLSG